MKAVIQRVKESKVEIDNNVKGKIGKGLNILLGVGPLDTTEDIKKLVDKTVNLRIFEDNEGKMNLSLLDIDGEVLVISQFTLYADVRKGRRPSFTNAAPPDKARNLYEEYVKYLETVIPGKVATGEFGKDMKVSILNDGPVTIIMDSNDLN
ncbi:MAG: D-tyrosyl-tRNA(Tyr) deacylase [Ruminococcaceae bacterium]|nr:D-tyrosyl-tRNA(Tyr) deacylase [Oscillospiraceae bacterium]